MVVHHQGHGLRPEDPHTVELAAVRQHLGEAQVIAGRRDKAGAAHLDLGRLAVSAGLGIVHHDHAAFRRRRVVHGEAIELLVGDVEVRVDHVQRVEDPLLQELAEGLAGSDLDHPARDFEADAVVPRGAGVSEQGLLRQLPDIVRQVVVGDRVGRAFQTVRRVGGGDRAGDEGVGQTGGVGHQVPDDDGPPRRLRLHVVAVAGDVDLRVRELGENRG